MGRSRRAEYPSLGSDGLAAVVKAIRGGISLSSRPSCDEVLAQYTELFELMFAQLSVLVGAKGAQAIAQRAIKRARAMQPALGRVALAEARVVLDGVRNQSSNAQELQRAVEHLFIMTMDVLASLIGEDLLITVLEKLTARGSDSGA